MPHAALNQSLVALLKPAPIVAVLTIEDAATARPLAEALLAGGIPALEITLRTPAALDAIRAIADLPGAIVGAGTVRSPEQAMDAIAAGARYLVSPGVTPRLVAAAQRWSVPFLPGVATASEAMALADLGYRCLKFFPAETAGGAKALASLAAPLAEITFCPTGGIDGAKAPAYLALPNVAAIGGSWMVPKADLANRDWRRITEHAAAAAALAHR